MGCAFLTAFNIFYENKIHKKKNINICIIGLGGLGLTCYYIAKYFGIKNIKCVEINRKKTDYLIRNFSVNKNSFLASDHKTNIKFDYVIDCVATKEVFSKNIDKLKNFGGKYIFLGNPCRPRRSAWARRKNWPQRRRDCPSHRGGAGSFFSAW